MDYIVDVEGRRLISSFTSTRTTTPESVVFGDEPDISVRLVESNPSADAFPWRYVDLTGHSIRVAIGNPGGDPSTGTFTLTFDGDTTTDLAAGSTAAQVDTALNALTSITSAGGVTVTSAAAGQYQIAFDSVGARNLITATTDALYPASSAYIYEATAGDVSTKEVQVANIEVDNAAYVELTTDIAAPAATITTVREGVTDTTSELQRIEISGDPYLGTFAITINGNTSDAISIDATLDELTTAIEGISGIGAGNVVVTGSITDFTIQFAASLGNVSEATVDVANLTGAIGKTGTIDFNTNQFLELLNGAATVSATLEIVKFKTTGSKSSTVLQAPITCREDVIADTPVSTTPFPAYAAASHTHNEADISDLGTTVTLNADTNLTGNGWFLDDDTMAANDAQKVASQQSIKAYVDAQVGGLAGAMTYQGGYVATADPNASATKGSTYTVTTGGTGAASYWSTALEVGDVIIAEIDNPATQADWTVVSKDIGGAPLLAASDLSDLANATTARTNLGVAIGTDVQAEISGASITSASVAGTDKVLIQDTDDSNNLKTVTAQSIADLGSGGGADGFSWQFDSTTTQADPGSGLFRLNSATTTTVTSIYIDDIAQSGVDSSEFFKDYPIGGYIYIEDKAGNALLYQVTTVTELTGYFAIGVTWESGTTLLTNNDVCYFRFLPSSANVTGPVTSTDNAIVRWDGTSGKTVQNIATCTIDDSGNIACTNLSGTNTGDEVTATTTTEGVVELATQAEVDAGTDTSRAVTPSTLANYTGLGIANVAEDSAPQLSGMLDVNGNAIGDGTDEVLSFVVNSGYASHVQIENNKLAVDYCKIATVGDDADIPLWIDTKGDGYLRLNSRTLIAGRFEFTGGQSTGDGTTTFSWNASTYKFTFGAQNEVFTFQTPTLTGLYSILHLVLIQDGVGGRTVTWPASVKWPGGTAPTLSTGANAVDIIKFVYDGTNYYGTYDLNFS